MNISLSNRGKQSVLLEGRAPAKPRMEGMQSSGEAGLTQTQPSLSISLHNGWG